MKCHKILSLLSLIFSLQTGYSQSMFNICHTSDIDSLLTFSWGFSIEDIQKDTIKLSTSLISGSLPNKSYYKSNIFNITDTLFNYFNRIDGTIMRRDFASVRGSFVATSDSTYVLGCTYIHYTPSLTQDTIKSGLIFIRKNGDTLYSRWFGQSVKFMLRSFERIGENLYMVGETNNLGGQRAHVVKTDLLGNLIWERTLITYTSHDNGAGGVCKVSNSGYFIPGIYNVYDVGPVHYGDCGIYKLDTNGAIQWYKKMFRNFEGGCFNIREDQTGNYFLSGNLDTLINVTDYPHSGYIAKIDSSANVIWLHIFNEIPHILKNMWQYRVLPDGDLIFCGERLEAVGSNVHIGWLCRMDSTGVIKWEHFYKQNDSSNYNCLAEVKQMADGGFIATGTCIDSLTKIQGVWLIRTDTNGCLIPGCVAPTSVEVFPEENMRVTLYPNPNTGSFTLESSNALPEKAMIKIMDITGRIVYTRQVQKGAYKTFITLQASAGIYLLQLISNKGERIYQGKLEVH